MGLPATVLSVTDQVTADFVTRVFAPVASAVSTPLWAAVTLFVALYGYMVMTGQIQHLYQTAFRNILLVGFVTYTALNWDWFGYFYDVFTQTPDMFSSTLSLGTRHPAHWTNFTIGEWRRPSRSGRGQVGILPCGH